MSKTVFLVSDGEYDDYRVKALFARRVDAERYVAELGGRIEEYPLAGQLDEGGSLPLYTAEGMVVREDLLSEAEIRSLGRQPAVDTKRVWPGASGPPAGEFAVDAYVVNAPAYGPLAHITVAGYDEAAVLARYAEVAAEKRREIAAMPDLRGTLSPSGGRAEPTGRGGFVRYSADGVDISTTG